MLVTGGKYHDFDFARRELLDLLAEHDEFRVRVQPDYEDADAIAAAQILVSYTCDVRPSERAQKTIREWVEGGGRWVALHGTNSALGDASVRPVATPRPFYLWVDTLGSQFIAHPPIEPYVVEVTEPVALARRRHRAVRDRPTSCTSTSTPDRAALVPLLHTTWQGDASGFVEQRLDQRAIRSTW